MSVHITINVSGGEAVSTGAVGGTGTGLGSGPPATAGGAPALVGFGGDPVLGVGPGDVGGAVTELRARMGDDVAFFPDAGIDAFLSHFILTVQFIKGANANKVVSWTMPTAIQTMSRSAPFIYQGPAANHSVSLPLPAGCTLPSVISERDFAERPELYFQIGKQVVWMQILNLDARMQTEMGPLRIILGETLKREYPDLFRPSLGVAASLGRSGFPARLFFNPIAIVETDFGNFRAIHGTLSYGRIISFPPIGTPVSLSQAVPMEPVEDLRGLGAGPGTVEPAGRIIALSHPIDMTLHLSGDEAFRLIEERTKPATS